MTTTTLDKLEIDHDLYMKRFGTIGTLAGAAIGTALLPFVPRSEATFTVIVPFTTTYVGLALGFLTAGVRKRLIEYRNKESDLKAPRTLDDSQNSTVHAVFRKYNDATGAFAALTAGGITPKQFIVYGKDSDDLRGATAALHTKRLDKKIITFAAHGFVMGIVWGYLGCPKLAATLPSIIISALMAGFCGALLGGLAGAQIAGMLQIDNGPVTDATMREAYVDDGVIAVSIRVRDEAEREFVSALLGANRVGYVPEPVPELVLQVAV